MVPETESLKLKKWIQLVAVLVKSIKPNHKEKYLK